MWRPTKSRRRDRDTCSAGLESRAHQCLWLFLDSGLCHRDRRPLCDLLSNIASEQRAKVVYEYLYRQIEDKKVRETIDFLLNREEAHNQMFRDAFNEVQDSGSNRDFGTTKAAKMYFSLSNPGPNAFAGNEVTAPKFAK